VPVEVAEEIVAQLEILGIRRGRYVLEPIRQIHKVIAGRLTEAARDTPTFPLTIAIEIDSLLALRAKYNEANAARISVNDLMLKASALALKQVPAVNSSFTPVGLVRHRHADIAMAVGTDSGLITPIILAAEEIGIAQISAQARDLSARARARKLKPDEYMGGTFAVSNLGMFGIASFGSIINPPHAAILSIGAATPSAVVASGEIRIATIMNVTLTCDHRVIDGITGANWLKVFRGVIEQPEQLFE
jgi:pyruvate dehydrogenase E2 component (dihydrolipoamide acetyltransferase)